MKRAQKPVRKVTKKPKPAVKRPRKSPTVSAAVRLIDRSFEYMAAAITDEDRRFREGASERIIVAVLSPIAEREFAPPAERVTIGQLPHDLDTQHEPGEVHATPDPGLRNATASGRAHAARRQHERIALEQQWSELNGRAPQG